MKDSTSKNYYELLGVPRNASVEQIKDAYKDIAKVYHPDSNFYSEIVAQPASTEQVDMFKALTAAYNTLCNLDKRRAYDETLPGEMPSWDEDDYLEDEASATLVRPFHAGKQMNKRSAAFGVFGKVPVEEDQPESSFDQATQNTVSNSGIFRKLRSILGL